MSNRAVKEKYYDSGKYVRQPCLRCGGSKEGTPSRSQLCANCRLEQENKEKNQEKIKSELKELRLKISQTPPGLRWCNFCKDYKDEKDDFYEKSSIRNSYECKDCHRLRFQRRNLEKIFGITEDEYQLLLSSQKGVCAICLNPPKEKRLAVDHDHKTGEIRGLLCWTCNNRVLGAARDNPEILRRAADYLESHVFVKVFGVSRVVPGFGKKKKRRKKK